jgi:hypothetical protein
MGLPDVADFELVLLNLSSQSITRRHARSVVGDARSMTQYKQNEFDVVFSNSVIEHVGTWSDQVRMARETRRVARRLFVQTPNRRFPIEPHFVFPAFQFLPRSAQVGLVRRFQLGHMPRCLSAAEANGCVDSIRLLTRGELVKLFPDAVIWVERILGMPKSFVAIEGWG